MAQLFELFSTLPEEGKEVNERINDYLEANPGFEVKNILAILGDRLTIKRNCLLVEFKTK